MLVFRQANGDIAADRAVFGLVAGVRRDVAAGPEVAVVARAVVDILVRPTPGEVTVLAVTVFGTDPAADLDAHVGAGNVVEPHTVQAANLHVLDRFDGTGAELFSNGNVAKALDLKTSLRQPEVCSEFRGSIGIPTLWMNYDSLATRGDVFRQALGMVWDGC